MAKSKCKCAEVECEECPEWIFTLADLIMCMMGLFVLLWVLKPAPGAKASAEANADWLKVVAKIREAFDYLPDPNSKDPVDLLMLEQKLMKMKPMRGPNEGGEQERPRDGATGTDADVTAIRQGKEVVVGGKALFAPDSVEINPATAHVLDEVAQRVRGHKNVILLKGHTSSDDFADGATPAQKMDLSLRRAQAVSDYLQAHGVEASVLRVLGCSNYEPVIQPAYTPAARQENRRVEIESMNKIAADFQGSGAATTKPSEAATGRE